MRIFYNMEEEIIHTEEEASEVPVSEEDGNSDEKDEDNNEDKDSDNDNDED